MAYFFQIFPAARLTHEWKVSETTRHGPAPAARATKHLGYRKYGLIPESEYSFRSW